MKKKKLTKQEQNRLIKNHNQLIKKDLESRRQIKTAPSGYLISLVGVNKVYPNHVQAVFDFNLDIKEKEFIVFVGPSGCGKSTTLRMIAGLEDITCGDLFLYGKFANDLLPSEREAAMVFQSYALYPNMSVYENLAFSLRVSHQSKNEIRERVYKVAEILEIEDYLYRKPSELSGGQRQRVALGRAIIRNAKVFLMDEPLSNLDAKLRISMRSEIVKLHKRIGATTIYVTHDQTEAMTMADRIVVMKDGYIQQIATPKEIFMKPNNLFVATFVGSPTMNILKVNCVNNDLMFDEINKISISDNTKKAIEQSYIKEKDAILNNINQKELEINEREYLLSRPKLLKARDHYYSKKIEYCNLISSLKKELENELAKEMQDIDKIDSIQKIIDRNEMELNQLEADYLDMREMGDSYLVDENKRAKLLAKDDELKILNDELIEEKEKLEKINTLGNEQNKCVLLGIRPENIKISKEKIDGGFEVEVDYFELLGNVSNVYFYINNQKVVASHNSIQEFAVGEKIFVEIDKESIHLFNIMNERRIDD